LVEDFRGALDPRNFFLSLDRARFLQQFRGICELCVRKRVTRFFKDSRDDGAFRRAQQTAQAANANASGLEFQLLYTFDHRLAPGAPAGTDVGDPVLRDAPPLDFIAAAHKGGYLAGNRKHHGDFGLVATDMSQIANIGLKLVPMALVRKTNDGIELRLSHELAHSPPAPPTLRVAKLGQPIAPFTAIDHFVFPRSSPR
jgi:hypothetical protein